MVFVYGAMLALYPPLILSFADVDTLGLMHSLVGIGSLVGVTLLSFWHIKRKMIGVLGAAFVTGAGCVLIGWRQEIAVIAVGLFCAFGAVPFWIGLNRAIYQIKAAPDVLGRIFSVRLFIGTTGQAFGAFMAGLLAERFFEPLALDSRGGAGRGIAWMFTLIGLLVMGAAVIAALIPRVRLLEDRLPDATRAQNSP
jgi:MFS family permease